MSNTRITFAAAMCAIIAGCCTNHIKFNVSDTLNLEQAKEKATRNVQTLVAKPDASDSQVDIHRQRIAYDSAASSVNGYLETLAKSVGLGVNLSPNDEKTLKDAGNTATANAQSFANSLGGPGSTPIPDYFGDLLKYGFQIYDKVKAACDEDRNAYATAIRSEKWPSWDDAAHSTEANPATAPNVDKPAETKTPVANKKKG